MEICNVELVGTLMQINQFKSEKNIGTSLKIVLKKWESQIQLTDSFWVSSKARFPSVR